MTEKDAGLPEDEALIFSFDPLPAEELDDREFVPFRVPATARAELMVQEAIKDLLEYEERTKARTRKRRAADQKTFETTVSALLCDAVHRELTEPDGWVIVTFDKSILGCGGRYRSTALNAKFPDIVRALEARHWIELDLGYHQHPFRKGNPSKRTRIRPGVVLKRFWIEAGLGRADFDLEDGEEVIILRRRRVHHRDRGGTTDYKDNETTNRYRDELRRINQWVRAASLAFEGETESGRTVDLSDRRLRRIFNDGSFVRGGRLYGGFWQKLNSDERMSGLTISGSPIAALDYGQTALRILYGMAGTVPQWTDGYVIPRLEGHREGVKKLLNAMLNRETPIKKYPKNLLPLFPPELCAWQAVRLIEAFHEPLRWLWRPRIGMELMFTESRILVDVLLRLIDLGIVALPVHDAVLVAEEHQDTTKEVMLQVFLLHTSIPGMVGVCNRSHL